MQTVVIGSVSLLTKYVRMNDEYLSLLGEMLSLEEAYDSLVPIRCRVIHRGMLLRKSKFQLSTSVLFEELELSCLPKYGVT